MSFTRFHDDPCRITKQLQQSTDPCNYILNTPGNGTKPYYMNDPQIIPQKWGGNIWTHSVDIQSSLLGIQTILNKDCIQNNAYKKETIYSSPIDYPSSNELTTEQSRTIMPSWTARDLTQDHSYILFYNPQNHVEIPFHTNKNTRLDRKSCIIKQIQH
jgi:hypothetical protein